MLDIIRLVKEFNGLPAGTEGTIVPEYDGTTYEVEFVDSEGKTIEILTTPAELIELFTISQTGDIGVSNYD